MKKFYKGMAATAILAGAMGMTALASGWDNSTGAWQYLDSTGTAVSESWKKSGDYWFYLGSDGNLVTDSLIQDGSSYYYVNEDGAMLTNQWVALENEDSDVDADYRWYYFGSDGKAYKDSNETLSSSDVKTINGKNYAFDEEGRMLFGFVDADNHDIKATSSTDWQEAEYYFGADGASPNGWVQLTVTDEEDEEQSYWFWTDENGKLKKNGSKTINGVKYYFAEDGHMLTDWVDVASNSEISSDTTASNATFISESGNIQKNSWIWAIPSEDYISTDYEEDEYSWFYTSSNGKLTVNTTKKINGKTYVFDSYGRMQYGLVSYDGTDYTMSNGSTELTDMTKDEYLAYAANLSSDTKIYYFSSSESDGAKKTGYQTVSFDDEAVSMYFNTSSGLAESGYLSKIKKYVLYGVILAADTDTSNYAAVPVNSTEDYKTLSGTSVVYYGEANLADGSHVLVGKDGTVQKSKSNLKDSNDIYYFTDSNGIITYASDKKAYSSSSSDHSTEVSIGSKTYYTE